ncbi:UDP-N-acetylmuramoyl-L-alanine--D-glutamate ligase [Alkalibacter mobilis]|uniref:UDP-N-acetylmuramoyl-L-alanine--D-glutamate ligase n=1 Tax=Alkalibacter mobilis TaxID=2787712 RepID=UPI00189D592C|nr:UDP-N-acetylmuramoyl-L-alanine--D-glutamate ligase [Alkalibacter mobilis]MBF7097128.1 UDP-N-acetylmuramoyl-L-alanine--D-glutamate ligase [Alkalibacter mobilis]
MNKKLIIGLGRSGIASANFLLKKGFRIVMYDKNAQDCLKRRDFIEILEKHHDLVDGVFGDEMPIEKINGVDLAIISPGIPLDSKIPLECSAKGIKIIGEIELAFRHLKAPVIGITGTNGKTTTTTLIYEIFKSTNIHAFLTGNIGYPIIDCVDNAKKEDVVIAELSSFQLESIENFRAVISVMLNITPDHLDRHKDMEQYIKAKENIYKNSTEDDFLVLNADDHILRKSAEKTRAKVIFFSIKETVTNGAFLDQGMIKVAKNGSSIDLMHISELKIPGMHNVKNVLAAAAVAYFYGIDVDVIKRVLCNFQGVEHRLEYVRELNGVTYYNDSKGTNTDAGITALDAIDGSVILIGGGYDKKSDFTDWINKFEGKVRKAYLIGETAKKIMNRAEELGFFSVEICSSLNEAVDKSHKEAKAGEVVLLSPACASWDMFDNYETRGNIFKELVNEL